MVIMQHRRCSCAAFVGMSLMLGSVPASATRVQSDASVEIPPPFTDWVKVEEGSLDGALFDGWTAYEALCSNFWSKHVRIHQYRKEGCIKDCATLTVDCNTGDDDGAIDITYTRHKGGGITLKDTKYSIFKKHRAHKNRGRFLLFDNMRNAKTGTPGMAMLGCKRWMSAPLSWCEGPKWTRNEDRDGLVPEHLAMLKYGDSWQMTYTWLRFEQESGLWILEEDSVEGERSPDLPQTGGLKTNHLGPEIGVMGANPSDPAYQNGYVMGATGWSQACVDNDAPMGIELPLAEDKECAITLWWVLPSAGGVVESKWHTIHRRTEEKKRFAA